MQAEPAALLQTHLPQQQHQHHWQGGQGTALPVAVIERSSADPAEPKEEQKGNGAEACFETVDEDVLLASPAFDDPALQPPAQQQPYQHHAQQQQAAVAQPAPCRSDMQLQPGQVVQLRVMVQQGLDAANLVFTAEELQLKVVQQLGTGASGKAYAVSSTLSNSAGHTTTGSAPAGSSSPAVLQRPSVPADQLLCLKLPRPYAGLSKSLKRHFRHKDTYLASSILSFLQQDAIMAELSSRSSAIPMCYRFGSIIMHAQPAAGSSSSGGSSCQPEPQPALLTELGVGGSLADSIQTCGMPTAEAKAVMYSVAAALEQLHNSGWVYLDLKPANIVLSSGSSSSSGGLPKCLLVDYGSAFQLGSRPYLEMPVVFCTAEFTAPQLFPTGIESPVVSYAADIYSFGLLLLAVRTGNVHSPLPQHSRNHSISLQAVQSSGLLAALDPSDASLIEQCLAPSPDQRPSIQQLLQHPYFSNKAQHKQEQANTRHAALSNEQPAPAHPTASLTTQQQQQAPAHLSPAYNGSGASAAAAASEAGAGDPVGDTLVEAQPNTEVVFQPYTKADPHANWAAHGPQLQLTVQAAMGSDSLYEYYAVSEPLPPPPSSNAPPSQVTASRSKLGTQSVAAKKYWPQLPKPYASLPVGLQRLVCPGAAYVAACTTSLQQQHFILSSSDGHAVLQMQSLAFGQVHQGSCHSPAVLLKPEDMLLTRVEMHVISGGLQKVPLSSQTTHQIISHLFSALSSRHKPNLVFGGLRPGSIAVAGRLYKLVGWDLAARYYTPCNGLHADLLGRAYTAPELHSKGGELTSQTDVWSLGMLLVHARTGLPPFAYLALLGPAAADKIHWEELCQCELPSENAALSSMHSELTEPCGRLCCSLLTVREKVFVRECLRPMSQRRSLADMHKHSPYLIFGA